MESASDWSGLPTELPVALDHVFDRFDEDSDGALSVVELQNFARACNGGDEFDEDELEQATLRL